MLSEGFYSINMLRVVVRSLVGIRSRWDSKVDSKLECVF